MATTAKTKTPPPAETEPIEPEQAEPEGFELPPVQFITPEEGREIFEYQARTTMGMSGEEFLRRWDAGEFDDDFNNGPLHVHRVLVDLVLLIPLARQDID